MTELERELRDALAEWVELFRPVTLPGTEGAALMAKSEAALASAREFYEEEQ
jgi:hypothetical protein